MSKYLTEMNGISHRKNGDFVDFLVLGGCFGQDGFVVSD